MDTFRLAFVAGFAGCAIVLAILQQTAKKKPSVHVLLQRSQLLATSLNDIVRQEDLDGIAAKTLATALSLSGADTSALVVFHRPHILKGGTIAGVRYLLRGGGGSSSRPGAAASSATVVCSQHNNSTSCGCSSVKSNSMEREDILVRPNEGLLGTAMRTARVCRSNTVATDIRCVEGVDYLAGLPRPPLCAVAVPIHDSSGEPVAVLQVWLHRRSPLLGKDELSDVDVEFLTMLGDSVAAVVSLQYDRVDIPNAALDVVDALFTSAVQQAENAAVGV